MQGLMKAVVRNLEKNTSYLEKRFCRNSGERVGVSQYNLYGAVLTFYAAKFTRDLELPANLHILFTSCSSHVTTFHTEFYSETAFHFGFEESEVRKVAFGEN